MVKLNCLCAVLSLLLICNNAQAEAMTKNLPTPDYTGGKALMQALKNRQSNKSFSNKAIDNQTLSELLWSAWGINRADGKRTVPTSMNIQNMRVYAIMADGAWLYDANKQKLTKMSAEDLRPHLATQAYATEAPLYILYTTNGSGEEVASAMHAGSMYQNVGLYSASKGLNNVVRSYFHKEPLAKALNIEEKDIIVSQVVGWPE